MFILFNFNSYLGGGETLFVRFADYLEKTKEKYFLFCHKGSYIEEDLKRIGIPNEKYYALEREIDYYYLKEKDRIKLLDEIEDNIPNGEDCYLISFCTRDLYTICDLNNRKNEYKLGHLILSDLDNLYVCQTIFDKLMLRLFKYNRYSSQKMIEFNSRLYSELLDKYTLIPMNDVQVKLWGKRYGIPLDYNNVVPLPTWDFKTLEPPIIKDKANVRKIIWIGRLVDFKLPALCAMINFVSSHKDFSLTIVGSGNKVAIDKYIARHNIDTSRLDFIGQVPYSKLGELISAHSIGYAMGTSIVEIGRYGLPVIMALGSPSTKFFKSNICGGVYFNVDKGNIGDNLYLDGDESKQPTIEESIDIINNNYVEVTKNCYNFIRESFDISDNIGAYIRLFSNKKDHYHIKTRIPQSGAVRRFLYYIFR